LGQRSRHEICSDLPLAEEQAAPDAQVCIDIDVWGTVWAEICGWAKCSRHERLIGLPHVQRGKLDQMLERLRAVKGWKAAQADRAQQEKEWRVQRNKHVLRTHERMSRQHSKLKDDDRTRRMDALRVSQLDSVNTSLNLYDIRQVVEGGGVSSWERTNAPAV